jgi:L-galactonate 5-dehydrogenase
MKAWAITEPGKTALIEKEKPTPSPDEELLKIHTVGYCGSGLNTFRGLNPLVD